MPLNAPRVAGRPLRLGPRADAARGRQGRWPEALCKSRIAISTNQRGAPAPFLLMGLHGTPPSWCLGRRGAVWGRGAGRGASPGSPGCGPRAAAALPCSLNSSLERPPFRPMGGVGLCWLAPRALGEGAFPLRPPVLFGLVCVGFWLLVLPRDLKIQITYQKVDSYNYFVIFASNSINNKNENEILFFFITISPPFVRVVDHCGGNFSFLT